MLSDAKVRSAKARSASYKLTDEKGLYLQVTPAGGRLWRLFYRFGGKQKTLAFGSYPEITLARAREKRDEARRLLAEGVDPSAKRKAEKLATANTFKAVAEEFLTLKSPEWAATHTNKQRRRLEWLYPFIGDKPVATIKTSDLLSALKLLEASGKGETAARTRVVAGQVLRYAIATDRAENDPTTALRGAFARVINGHYPAITDPEPFGGLLRAIDGYAGDPVTRAALRLLPLVFVRPGELRLTEWTEIDLDAATWSIPARRMKTKAPHVVPLSKQAVAILQEVHPLTGKRTLVFPSLRTRDRPLSENTLNAALRRLGYAKDMMTAHGFRAAARTMLDEVLGFRVDVIEHQLAHAVKDPLGRAYNRTAFLAERRKMMQDWADYLDSLKCHQGAPKKNRRRG